MFFCAGGHDPEESLVEQPKPNLAAMAMLFIIGIGTLTRFAAATNLRAVELVGISGGGAACGAALFGFIYAIMASKKT
jgi:hypothetical protein